MMPEYTIRDPQTGRTIKIRGDSPPTEQELEQLFASTTTSAATPPSQPPQGPTTDLRRLNMFAVPQMVAERTISKLNPLPMIGQLYDVARSQQFDPWRTGAKVMEGLIGEQVAQFPKAAQAAQEGRASEAVGYTTAGLLPLFGPPAAAAGEEIGAGRIPEGIGDALALLLTLGGPSAASRAPTTVRVPPLARHPNPAVAEAVQWGLQHKVPVEMGPAIGSDLLTGATELFEHTPLGNVVGRRTGRASEQALAREGTALQARAYPQPVVPEQAGKTLQQLTEGTAERAAGQQRAAYAGLEALETSKKARQKVQVTPFAKKQNMQAPVDLRKTKDTLIAPLVAELERELAPVQGLPSGMRLGRAEQSAAEALVTARRLLDLPDYAPAASIDPLLSAMKAFGRRADSPLSRTRAQGLVAKIVTTLEGDLQTALTKIGPEAVEALRTGREATKTKYRALELRKSLGAKAVPAYRKMVQPGDANIEQLTAVLKQEPSARPVIARGYLQSLMERATAEGGFEHAARIKSEWQKLGPQTKRLLFPDDAYRADLDRFFTLAAETTRPFNTSKSALAIAAGTSLGAVGAAVVNPIGTLLSILGTGGFVKAMHSPAFVKAVTEGLRVPVRSRAQRAASLERALVAAQTEGVAVPAAALAAERQDETSTPTIGPSSSRPR